MLPRTVIKDLSLNISNFCLSSCKYCNLCQPGKWGLRDEIDLGLVERTLKDPILDGMVTCHLTGGEPFLSPKFLPIMDMLYEYYPNVAMNLPTNALYPHLIERIMTKVVRQTPQLKLNIGFEGPNREVHESVRGLGSWDPMMETVRRLKPLEVPMCMNMTVWKENYREIESTYLKAKEMDLPFYLNFGRYSRRFGNDRDEMRSFGITPEEYVSTIESQVDAIGWRKWRKFNEQKWVLFSSKILGKEVSWQCLAGIEGIDVFPDGTVYPCLMYFEECDFGNLKDVPRLNPLSTIMVSPRARKIQEFIYSGECSRKCPFTCALRLRNIKIDGREVVP